MVSRYFIGITPPDDLTLRIAHIQRSLFVPHKIMSPLAPHITLIDPNTLHAVSPSQFLPKIKAVTDTVLPIDISLTRTALFGNRVFFIMAESPKLLESQQKLMNLLPEDIRTKHQSSRPFCPHITIAQAKPSQSLSPTLIKNFEKHVSSLLPRNFTAESLTYFQWIRPRTYRLLTI